MCVFFLTWQWECCGAFGADDWNLNIYFNCTDSNPSREKCGVPFSCCTKDPGVCSPTPQHSWRFLFTVDSYLCSVRVPFIDRNGWSELLCLSLWSVFIGEEVLISLSVTEKFGYLHPAEGRLRLDSNRTSRPQRLALGQSVAAPLVTLFCRGRRFTCLQPELHQELFSWWSSDFSLVASHQECSGTSGH